MIIGSSIFMNTEERPWGNFKVIHSDVDFKVKLLVVRPGSRLSYQRHLRRAERWTVVRGSARVVVEDLETVHDVGDVITIRKGQRHRLENPGSEDLVIVEVQIGDYLGEDDIERLEDDYGRP